MKRGLFTRALITVGLLCVATLVEGADWVLIGKSKDGNLSISVDKESIDQVSEDIVRSCQRFSYVKPILLNNSQKPVTKIVAYREWDCDGEKYNNLQVTFYYVDGTKETETYKYALWHHIKQSTPESNLFEYVCTQE